MRFIDFILKPVSLTTRDYTYKLRFTDVRRGKGKRGGLRVIYYWWDTGSQFWLFTLYDKDEMTDLAPLQRKALKEVIKQELDARRKQ